MRICVNQDGIRQDESVLDSEFLSINKLTVIASESYDSFARSLQDEMIKNLSRKSYEIMDDEHFINQILVSDIDKNDKRVLEKADYRKIHNLFLETYHYIDAEDKITDILKEDISSDKLKVPTEYQKYSESYKNLIKNLYTDIKVEIDNDSKTSIPKEIKPNGNFKKKEFIDLWKKINVKTSYYVDFNSGELIEKAVKELDDNLVVSKTIVKITKGGQNEFLSYDDIKKNTSLKEEDVDRIVEETSGYSNVKYDLVGDLSDACKLTRKTIATILSKIKKETFDKFKENPEEFIRKASELISEQKGTTIIDGLRYNKIDGKFDDQDVWTVNSMGAKLDSNAIEAKKCVFDYVLYDSTNEKNFTKELEKAKDVVVYAKLPNKFYIETPLGNYNPDWALCYDDSRYKYIYFIAETKGALGSAHLRPVEKAKIECAKKHFSCIFDKDQEIKYDVISTYDELISRLNGG